MSTKRKTKRVCFKYLTSLDPFSLAFVNFFGVLGFDRFVSIAAVS
jgi:hypothetical protein